MLGEDLYRNQGKVQSFGYMVYQMDEVAGTYFAQAREYLPEEGRFTGEDRIKRVVSEPVTLNSYTYCRNNALKYIELNGRWYILVQEYDDKNSFSDIVYEDSKIQAYMENGVSPCTI